MTWEIKEIKEKEVWENFLSECSAKTFLQSFLWGEFQKSMGNEISRLGIFAKQRLMAVFLIIKILAKRGAFLFLPHGPVIKNYQAFDLKLKIFQTLTEFIKKIAQKEKVAFVRIAPILEKNEENEKIFKVLGFKKAPLHLHPEITWEADISLQAEEILKKMRKTTRYLIRQALKNPEIEIVKSDNLKDLEIFYQIYKTTAKRANFHPFSFDYLKNEFLTFLKDKKILLFLGKYRHEVLSGGIFIFWQKMGFYHHGASLHCKVPVSYCLLWEAIMEAKKRGCEKFNFWGIAPPEKKNHPWAGLSFFKMGFGGYKKEYLNTQDLPISLRYWLNFIIEKIRKIKRGL